MSDQNVAAVTNMNGTGNVNFNGSYSGFSSGGSTFYLPAVVHNYYGWYSMVSVQNLGDETTNLTLQINCNNIPATGILTAADVPPRASEHFVLKTTIPQGFTADTRCNGSAVISSSNGQPIAAVDNQSVPTLGNTQSFGGVTSGAPVLYVPALYNNHYGWNASLNIRKLSAGNTTVTITYSDEGSSQCSLTDAYPSCLLYMPTVHPRTGYFGARITSNNSANLVAVANSAWGSQAQTYNAVGSGSRIVSIPSVMKNYYGWDSSFTCQNVGNYSTTLQYTYSNVGATVTTTTLDPNETVEIFLPDDSVLQNHTTYQGSVTVTASYYAAKIACTVNFNNQDQTNVSLGDWSMSYNAFGR